MGDSPTNTDGVPDDDLPALEERLAELGGHRRAFRPRPELADEGLPLTRDTVTRRAGADPERRRRTGMTSSQPSAGARRAPGRDRELQRPARTRAMLLRYTESAFAEIGAAARDAGLTPSGYTADAALAMADLRPGSYHPAVALRLA